MSKEMRNLSGKVSIVGVGDTDYGADYKAARKGLGGRTSTQLAVTAFNRALADAGLKKEDIDGLIYAVGGATAESITGALGIKPKYIEKGGHLCYGVLPEGVERTGARAIAAGKADTIALVYGTAQRSEAVEYGGPLVKGNINDSYYYYHPWGWSAQAAHWALVWQYYSQKFGYAEEDLSVVPITTRKHAMLNENAIMRTPLTVQDYMDSRYVVRPLHLFDICLVNDGGVCVILRRTDRAKDMPHTPVKIMGWGDNHPDNHTIKNKMHYLVEDYMQTFLKDSGGQAYSMAAMNHNDIQHLQSYDHASFIVPLQVEGLGFAKRGEGLAFCQDGRLGIGGELPVNTSGGMLSEAYMQAWNQLVEAVRQLRHEAGARQVKGIETSMYCFCSSNGATTFIYQRG